MAEKYVGLSPYEYVGGNPILRIDPDGMDWDKEEDENGNIHFTITVQVRNTAGISEDQMNQYLSSIQSSFKEIFQGEGENGESYTSEIIVDTEGKDEKSSDFYIDFVNEVEMAADNSNIGGLVDNIGDMEANRIQLKVGREAALIGISGAHEVGHTGGLYHPDKLSFTDALGKPVESDNLMFQANKASDQYCRTITPSQLSRVNNYYDNGFTVPESQRPIPSRSGVIQNNIPQFTIL